MPSGDGELLSLLRFPGHCFDPETDLNETGTAIAVYPNAVNSVDSVTIDAEHVLERSYCSLELK